MKRLLFAGIIAIFASNIAFAQIPNAPDKNPPVATPQQNLGYNQNQNLGYAQRTVVVANPQAQIAYQQQVVVAQPDPVVVYQQPQVVAVRQVVVASNGYGHCDNNFGPQATPYSNNFGGGFNQFGGGFNMGFGGGFNNFGGGFGRGVNISAIDRRGTVVNASGNNRVRIQRGPFGNIRGARAF